MPGGLLSIPTTTVALMATAGAGFIAAQTGPSALDTWSAFGAMLASVITVFYARQSDRSLDYLVCVFIGSVFAGIVLPGAVVHTVRPGSSFTWHIWSGLGFVCGLGGWALTHALRGFFTARAPAILEWVARRIFGPLPPPPLPPPPPPRAETDRYKVE